MTCSLVRGLTRLAIQLGMAALLAQAQLIPNMFLCKELDSFGHPAGHGSSVGQSQLIS
jgi:hypothetical protein